MKLDKKGIAYFKDGHVETIYTVLDCGVDRVDFETCSGHYSLFYFTYGAGSTYRVPEFYLWSDKSASGLTYAPIDHIDIF